MNIPQPKNDQPELSLDQIKIIDIIKRAHEHWVVTKEFVNNKLVITIRIAIPGFDSTEPFASVTVDEANLRLLISYDEEYNLSPGSGIYKHILEEHLSATGMSIYLA